MASGWISLKELHAGFHLLQKVLAQSKKTFGILVIGEAGSGMSTLINNILGKNVAKVGHTTQIVTTEITPYDGTIQGVPVRIYDTPGLDDISADDPELEEAHLKNMKAVMDRGEIALVIFCFKMIETRMSRGNIHTFKTYHKKLKLNWEKVIIALTFADAVPRYEPYQPPAVGYQRRLKQLTDHIGEALRNKVGVAIRDEDLRIHPVTETYEMKLPNDKEWFSPLWLSVMKILESSYCTS